MKRILLLWLAILPFSIYGQNRLTIRGSVEDYVTRHPIPGSFVTLLSADSMVVDTATAKGLLISNGKIIERYAKFYLKIPQEGKYIIRIQKQEYDTRLVPIEISKIHHREMEREIPSIYLQRTIAQDLEEVTVTATKVKFYNKGDTLIYNADAFRLAEGSMLDALIRQLPGAELKADGQIYVNGKFVKSLLLNGKDFFKGNNQIMLDNLPTYMVNTVKVYDKEGELSELIGRDVGDKEMVMDVNLKKQYNIGWIGNLSGGGGTDHRYLGRLFAMRFTDHSQLSVYGNMNNTNDIRKPGQDVEWSPEKMPHGLLSTKMAGVDYSINDRNKRFKLNGNVQVNHSDNNISTQTNRTNFLVNGNTLERIINEGQNLDTHVSTFHDFYFKSKRYDIRIKPELKYHRSHNNNQLSSVTSIEDQPEELLNRNRRQTLLKGNDWKAGLQASSTIKMKYSPDALMLNANVSLADGNIDDTERNKVDFLSGETADVDFRHLYKKYNPGKIYNYSLKAGYLFKINSATTLTSHYMYGRDCTSASRSLYRIEQLPGWGADTQFDISDLPSIDEYKGTLEPQNSYRSRIVDNIHEIGIFLNWSNVVRNKYMWWAQVNIPVSLHNYNLQYHRASVDTAIVRNAVLLDINSTFIQWKTLDGKQSASLAYSLKSAMPDMTFLVDVKDDSDPLRLVNGNPALKSSLKHRWDLTYNNNRPDKQRQLNLQLSYSLVQNALAMGTIYENTGRRIVTPNNIDGNWSSIARAYYSTPIGKKRSFYFRNILSAIYNNNVDLVGVESILTRSVVKNLNLTETFKIDYKIYKHQLSVKAGAVWTHATGNRTDFKVIDAINCNYGFVAQLYLPWKFKLDTDFTIYHRRGYAEAGMNTNDLVWNVRISRSVLKERFLLMLDAFDMLGKLNNVQYRLDGQGRTEMLTNVTPRYLMLHAVYRFNALPSGRLR